MNNFPMMLLVKLNHITTSQTPTTAPKGSFLLQHFFQQQFRLYAASPAQRQHTGLHRAFGFHPAAIQQKNIIQQGEARIVLITIQNDNFKWLIFSIDFFEELGVII
ncbi:MAG: hypothetical protein QM668_16020 [Agriterribacter sp.]